jgi:hypothetical protein
MLFKWSIEVVGLQGAAAANEPWLAFPPRQEITIERLGEYTRIVLTKSELAANTPREARPAWA